MQSYIADFAAIKSPRSNSVTFKFFHQNCSSILLTTSVQRIWKHEGNLDVDDCTETQNAEGLIRWPSAEFLPPPCPQ